MVGPCNGRGAGGTLATLSFPLYELSEGAVGKMLQARPRVVSTTVGVVVLEDLQLKVG
jgi:hypothetical protein